MFWWDVDWVWSGKDWNVIGLESFVRIAWSWNPIVIIKLHHIDIISQRKCFRPKNWKRFAASETNKEKRQKFQFATKYF